jgi:hypothetical protein
VCGICCCPFFILSNPFLNSFTPYSLNATCCDDCGCSASALEFVPGATANADGLAEISDCHQVHYVHMLYLSSLWRWLLYKMMCIIEERCIKGMFTYCSGSSLLHGFKAWAALKNRHSISPALFFFSLLSFF